ncbi:ATPase AAA [Rhizobium leucaenae]|uniref:Adenylate kinase family enzyme n=1 Tax=Rhizobium leucaenae TaxID=29450 RepID=A0A7W6ZWW3_9HYPH|nr:ATPase AAA [Rhizobium leucaenae]MBB4569638.1 adenylate kinase family enzyme [Rhizobium leucaenae]MBB6304456.1 adenylate kinase family enzyme [Rhizobium leucaenae]
MDQIAIKLDNEVTDLRQAADHIRGADRILVMGCSGGGKSTLSQQICAHLDLPYVSMDREFFWLPGWINRDKAEERALIAAKVAEERWLIDGTAPSSFDLRLPRTELVLWVRMPRWLCMWGALSRALRWLGRSRPDMAPGCPERIDWEFLRYIWDWERKFAPKVLAGIAQHAPDVPVLQLKSRGEMRRLLDLLSRPA